MEYIDLNRTFEIPSDNDNDYSYLTLGSGGHPKTTWVEILSDRLVVVLASASSGKTVEFQNKTKTLNVAGKTAVFLPLDSIAKHNIEDCLDTDNFKQIETWKQNLEAGYFFLDSVDEAKLTGKRDFKVALQKFANFLGDHVIRAHIFISCRPSDWNSAEDSKIVTEIFRRLLITTSNSQYNQPELLTQADADMALLTPVLKAGGLNISDTQQTSGILISNDPVLETNSKVKTYHLETLDNNQQQQLAINAGVSDPDAFTESIRLNGLDGFTKRPGDLLNLASYWKQNQGFDKLSKMIDDSINRQLIEEESHRVNDVVLSEDEARIGAERLAAALVLAKRLSILAPGYEALADNSSSIDPKEILADWTPAKRESLLRRGLFAPECYGRVRFLHRSSIEYLAACWLNRYIQQDHTRKQIESILFPTIFGVETVTPELRPSAAWLALFDERIREKILLREPLELIRHGDPKSLPISIRIKLLKHIADKHLAGDIAHDYLDYRSIWAFSSPELADVIHEVWLVNCDVEFRFFLLQIIAAGKIVNCIDLVENIINDYANKLFLLAFAVETLVMLDASAPLQRAADQLLDGSYGDDGETLSRLSHALFPDFLSLTELLTLIKQATTPKRHSSSGFGRLLPKLFEKCPKYDKDQLLNDIAELALSKPHIESYQRISKRYGYLANNFTDVADIVLQCLPTLAESKGFIKLLMAAERSDEAASKSLTDVVNNTLDLKQRLFWADVHEKRTNCADAQPDEKPFVFLYEIRGKQYWQLGLNDTDWLLAFVLTDHPVEDQTVAYYAAIEIFRKAEQLHDEADRLRKIAGNRPELHKHLDNALTPFKIPDWAIEGEQRQAHYDVQRECEQEKGSANWKQYRSKLQKTLPQAIFSSGISNDSYHLILNLSNWLTMSDENNSRTQGPRGWKNLIPAFGESVAKCYVLHLQKLWRYTKSERPRWNGNTCTTKHCTLFAFAGIGIEADLDTNWAKNLSNKEAELATQHALLSGHGVPDWFHMLYKEHTDIVLPLLRSELKHEWKLDADFRDSWLSYFAINNFRAPDLAEITLNPV